MYYVLYEEELESDNRIIWDYGQDLVDMIPICCQLNSGSGWHLRRFTDSVILIRAFNNRDEAIRFIDCTK